MKFFFENFWGGAQPLQTPGSLLPELTQPGASILVESRQPLQLNLLDPPLIHEIHRTCLPSQSTINSANLQYMHISHFIFKLQLKQLDAQPDYHCDMRSAKIVKCYISHYSTFWFTFALDSHSVINIVTVPLPVTEDIMQALRLP